MSPKLLSILTLTDGGMKEEKGHEFKRSETWNDYRCTICGKPKQAKAHRPTK